MRIDGNIAHYDSETDLYDALLEHNGIAHQSGIFIEEAAELIKELQKHHNRGCYNIREICEEIADVEISLEQLRYRYDAGGEIDAIKRQKLVRLADRLAEQTNL